MRNIYFGIGNENWGCGGQMTPEYYADQYRRYATYVRNLSGKIACGPCGGDYNWTEVMMKQCAKYMDMLSLHYYYNCIGGKSKSATQFEEDDWFRLLNSALVMDGLVAKHAAIMDKYDAQNRVGLAVDEWGAWHNVEPGTNPSFLYQQNTIRDAVAAAVTLNIFNRHCDRVRMANIAQTVNVLQAMILTDKERMILTPTYHVFEMYSVHQNAVMLPVDLQCEEYRHEQGAIPGLSVSASRSQEDNRTHISLCNLNATKPAELTCELSGTKAKKVTARMLTADSITAHNTFDKPDTVKPAEFKEFSLTENGLKTTLPARSVVVFEIE